MNEVKITLSQLEQYLSKAAWILKGPVDASDFKVYISLSFSSKEFQMFTMKSSDLHWMNREETVNMPGCLSFTDLLYLLTAIGKM